MNKWIDCNPWDRRTKVGDIGYLVETLNTNNGCTSFSLHDRPKRTNRSHAPRLTGWCGTTNNMNATACGAWKVVKVNKAGDRALIVRLEGADLACFLATDGYDHLMPDDLKDAWIAGDEDGDEAVCDLYNDHGIDAVIATTRPGHVSWDDAARSAHAHKTANVADDMREVYYAGYQYGAKARVETMLREHEAGK